MDGREGGERTEGKEGEKERWMDGREGGERTEGRTMDRSVQGGRAGRRRPAVNEEAMQRPPETDLGRKEEEIPDFRRLPERDGVHGCRQHLPGDSTEPSS